MNTPPTDRRDTEGSPFEHTLRQLLLDAYTDGHTVEGEWTITVPITDTPDWTVTITKSYSEEDSAYQPTILEE